MDFTTRSHTPELMDDPNVPEDQLRLALKDIALVNKYLGGNAITIKALEELISLNPNKKVWRVIDFGCGDGEVLRQIATYFKNHSKEIQFLGVDINQKSIDRARIKSSEFTNLKFRTENILDIKGDALDCDVILCTLTMHHFSDEEILVFLKRFKKLAALAIIINDLHRSKIAYRLFQLFSGIFMKSKIAKHDGRISIARAFKKEELETYSKELAGTKSTIQWRWAFRYLWVIKII